MVVLAINAVSSRLPKRIQQVVTERQRLVAPGPDEHPVVIERRKGTDKVRARKGSDGSLIVDTGDAPVILRGMLAESGIASSEIDSFLKTAESALEGVTVDSGAGVAVIKQPIEPKPDLSGPTADDRAAGIIAFGYLALLLGDLICDPYFDDTRLWLRGGGRPVGLNVETFYSGSYEPHHAVASKHQGSDLVVQVILFGGVVFNIAFPRLYVDGTLFVCLDEVSERRVLIAEGLDEAAKGTFYVIQGASS